MRPGEDELVRWRETSMDPSALPHAPPISWTLHATYLRCRPRRWPASAPMSRAARAARRACAACRWVCGWRR